MVSVADGFGIDLVSAARPAFKEAGIEVVYDQTYPLATSDFSPVINEAMASGADSFVAFSYPPDTFALTQQAQVANFNPKVLYLGVGDPCRKAQRIDVSTFDALSECVEKIPAGVVIPAPREADRRACEPSASNLNIEDSAGMVRTALLSVLAFGEQHERP